MNRWGDTLPIILFILVIIVCLAQFPAVVKSIAHGFGWGIGREAAHSMFHHTRF